MWNGRQEWGAQKVQTSGHVTLRRGRSVLHGLTVADAKELLAEVVDTADTLSSNGPLHSPAASATPDVGGGCSETSEEFVWFASWFQDLPEWKRAQTSKTAQERRTELGPPSRS